MATQKAGSMKLMLLLIFTFLCCLGFDSSLVAGASTIRSGDELNSAASPLVSQGGKFTLGFFTATSSSYLGIWYTNDESNKTKVWVANPNRPILNNSGVLTIDSTGRLKLMSGGNTLVNISDQVGTGNVSATLEDSGNFVVMDETHNSTLWQSFDHPSSTQLPGMKLGFNSTTRQNWTLTSWLSDIIPATGDFTLRWERTQQSGHLVIQRRGERYWTSGDLKDQNFEHKMELLNQDGAPYHYILNNVSASDGSYFTFSVGDERISFWNLDPSGYIADSGANSSHALLSPLFCYGYPSDNGCENFTVPMCRSHGDEFLLKHPVFKGGSLTSVNDLSLTLGDCMEKCWNNCTCVAFTTNSSGVGCVFHHGNLDYTEDQRVAQNQTLVLVPATNSSKGNKCWIWLITAVAISLLML